MTGDFKDVSVFTGHNSTNSIDIRFMKDENIKLKVSVKSKSQYNTPTVVVEELFDCFTKHTLSFSIKTLMAHIWQGPKR